MDEDSQSSDTLTDSDLTIPQNYRQPYHEQLRFHEDNFISDDAVSDNGHIDLNDNLSSSSTNVDGDLRQLGEGDNQNNPPPVGTDLNPAGDWHHNSETTQLGQTPHVVHADQVIVFR